MSTFRFEPIAIQLGKLVSLDRLLPPDRLLDAAGSKLVADEPPLPADVVRFMSHYMALARAGWQLLGAPQLARLSALYESIEQEYMPGGPPQSPVYDSYATQHILAEVPHGLAAETPYTVLARLTSTAPGRERLHRLAQALADSHLDLYRVTEATGLRARLEPLRGGETLSVALTGPFLRTDDRILARVLPFEGGRFIADSPYLLKASERAWLDYLERVTQAADVGAARDGSTSSRPSPGARLTPKQLARRRQQQKAAAEQKTPDAAIVRHLRYGASERYWLDFIMDGYAGERRGIVYLAGVPDRPETLPHHDAYEPSADDAAQPSDLSALPPMQRLRAALVHIAEREGITALAEQQLRQACEQHGLSRTELHEGDRTLFTAYCTLAARSLEGLTALELLERQGGAKHDERERIEALKRGWFSVLRVDRVHLDTGFEVLDVLRRKKLRISERAATRQVATGDLLIGWLCEDADSTLTLEGGLIHVPSFFAPAVVEMAKTLRDQARNVLPNTDWRARAGELPPLIILAMMTLREQMPLPELRNTSGHALQPATGRYTVRDARRVIEGLTTAFERVDDHTFAWYDPARTLLATFELSGKALLVHVNSHERLQAAKQRLEHLLGGAIAPSLDLLEGDVTQKLRARLASDEPPPPLPDLPADVAPQIHAMVLQHISGRLDEALPMFKGKTLRQLARGKATRADAINWLREQERFLKHNPQMKSLDLRPVWRELGLEYQGMDTDAR